MSTSSPAAKSRSPRIWYLALAAFGVALVALFAILVSRASAEHRRFISETSQALLLLQKENRPAVFSSNVVVLLDPVAGQAARFNLPAQLRYRNPLVCIVTSNRVDLRCVVPHYILPTKVSDRWVLER